MKLFFVLCLLVAAILALPSYRFARQAYYNQNAWGGYNGYYQNAAPRVGYTGIGGPSGEGSTWEGGRGLSIFG